MSRLLNNWDPEIEYMSGSVVKFDSKLYVCMARNINVIPAPIQILTNYFNSVSNATVISVISQTYNSNKNINEEYWKLNV